MLLDATRCYRCCTRDVIICTEYIPTIYVGMFDTLGPPISITHTEKEFIIFYNYLITHLCPKCGEILMQTTLLTDDSVIFESNSPQGRQQEQLNYNGVENPGFVIHFSIPFPDTSDILEFS